MPINSRIEMLDFERVFVYSSTALPMFATERSKIVCRSSDAR